MNERSRSDSCRYGSGGRDNDAIERPCANGDDEDQAIRRALRILTTRLRHRDVFPTMQAVKDYLRLQAQGLTHEVFAVMYLDARGRMIEYERMFRGTLTQTAVYPREIAKQSLSMHAASVILHHNHPDGVCLPSPEDVALTHCLRAALDLVDIRVLDHIVTTEDAAISMEEAGLLS
ncbi:MAG TPA: JAB domain-containing protein [Ramlibacter sp.]|uniref:JAB domain-containing protein n=1 Tax=Ramlibacter sp. TaxID=1917967 RepID=UPI002CFA76AB|nr:JAB domain-containing protein [Ramlibacter sp.]HVZ46354.1 JAB domain-containing protein [Ramlibacter sp.]